MEKGIEYFRQCLAGARVLLVEDEDISRKVVSEVLRSVGLEVVAVVNGREAVDTVQSQGFDVVLMDVAMPELDGYDATREIRSNPEMADLPIVAMTAYAGEDDRRRMRDAGMNDHVAKPVDMETLLEVIARWVCTT